MANVRVRNQRPAMLSALYPATIMGCMDVGSYIKHVFKFLRDPLIPSQPVSIDIDGNDVSDDDILNVIMNCCSDLVDASAEDIMRDILSQSLQYYNPKTKLLLKDMFVISAAAEAGLDEPTPTIIYTPGSDIIPASKGFLAGRTSYAEFFASYAFYARFEAFGAYFLNEIAFNDFKVWFDGQIAPIRTQLSPDCQTLINDFMHLTLSDLTESFVIRKDENDNNGDLSFARILIAYLMQYFATSNTAGIMPFDFDNLFCPKNVVFINVEKFSNASPSKINAEIDDINSSIDMAKKIPMISNKNLRKLAPMARQLRKSQAQAIECGRQRIAARAARTKLKSKIMTNNEYLKIFKIIFEKMKTERMTQNIYKATKSSFAKPNRRNPDDYNLQGKITSTKYRPDIHLYIDTSGSVSEENYKAAVKLAIQMARQLNVNLYINTFSSVLSQTTLLRCAGKSVEDIYRKFQKIDKVTGGTDFEQIWHFINANKKREAELSLMITDFEWSARSKFVKHPKNLYYMPCANMNWKNICYAAENFIKSCEHNDPDIRRHILA